MSISQNPQINRLQPTTVSSGYKKNIILVFIQHSRYPLHSSFSRSPPIFILALTFQAIWQNTQLPLQRGDSFLFHYCFVKYSHHHTIYNATALEDRQNDNLLNRSPFATESGTKLPTQATKHIRGETEQSQDLSPVEKREIWVIDTEQVQPIIRSLQEGV